MQRIYSNCLTIQSFSKWLIFSPDEETYHRRWRTTTCLSCEMHACFKNNYQYQWF